MDDGTMMTPYGYGPPPSHRQEMPLLAEGFVQVTSARFIVGQQTYPIASITHVAPFTLPAKRALPILFAVLFGLFAILGAIGGSLGTFVLFALPAALCIFIAIQRKDEHGVMVSTAGMQHRALVTIDLGHIQRVVGAINHAISMR